MALSKFSDIFLFRCDFDLQLIKMVFVLYSGTIKF